MTNLRTVRILFAGGGTGGHLFPAIAIADRLKEIVKDKLNLEIHFVGTERGIEYRLKDKIGYPLHTMNIRGIARSLTLKNLIVPFLIIGSLLKSLSLLKKFKPKVVIGTGGYVCWPLLKAAAWKNIPTCLQEQNSFPGVTIRQLAPGAKKIFLGFKRAESYLNTNAEIIVSGNPVRGDITDGNRSEALAEYKLDPNKKTILILGGSQGARAINRAVLKTSLLNSLINTKYQLLWQTGKGDYKDVAVEADARVLGVALFPFADDMAKIYSAADLVIARAGALTLAEISECGLPAVLIPYPHAAGDHQRKNALDYVDRGMATMIEEKELEQFDILEEAVKILDSEKYQNMKDAIARENEGKKKAVDIIAENIASMIMKEGN